MAKRVWDFLTRADTLYTLGSAAMSTGAYAWLGQQWEWLASGGWAAILLVSIALAATTLIAITSAYRVIHAIRMGRRTASGQNPNEGDPICSSPAETGSKQGSESTQVLVSEDVRREFGIFVHTKLAEGRLPCARMLMQLTMQLCRSNDKIKKWVGWGAASAEGNERDAWSALTSSIDSAKAYDELEDAFAEYYVAFIMLRNWIPRAAFTLGCLDGIRGTAEFREASFANDKIYSEVREFVMLRPRLRSKIEPWAAHINLMIHDPD